MAYAYALDPKRLEKYEKEGEESNFLKEAKEINKEINLKLIEGKNAVNVSLSECMNEMKKLADAISKQMPPDAKIIIKPVEMQPIIFELSTKIESSPEPKKATGKKGFKLPS
jgi:phosphosulfolactate synthase (CoM biosynthesis protein A)